MQKPPVDFIGNSYCIVQPLQIGCKCWLCSNCILDRQYSSSICAGAVYRGRTCVCVLSDTKMSVRHRCLCRAPSLSNTAITLTSAFPLESGRSCAFTSSSLSSLLLGSGTSSPSTPRSGCGDTRPRATGRCQCAGPLLDSTLLALILFKKGRHSALGWIATANVSWPMFLIYKMNAGKQELAYSDYGLETTGSESST